jgi:hypothetical protein
LGNPKVKVIPFKKRSDLHRFQTYSSFWKREDLDLDEKGLIHVLLAHLDKNGECWPTHPQLCRISGMGHSKLEKVLKTLRKKEEVDWVHFTDKWGHRRNRYVVLSFKKCGIPTPTNQQVATHSKSAGKHITIYPEGAERIEESPEKYGLQA